MSSVPIPLLSLLRRALSSIALRGRPRLRTFIFPAPSAHTGHSHRQAHSHSHSHVRVERRNGAFVWSWNSILRATALPYLGYLFGWNTVTQSNLNSSGKASVHHTSDDKERPKPSKNGEREPNEKGNSKNIPDPEQKASLPEPTYDPKAPIYQLMNNPAIFDPLRSPRYPIVLAHGLYGFDVRGFAPYITFHYWSDVLQILRKKLGAEVIVTRAPSTGSIQDRAETLHKTLKEEVKGRQLNFIAHSMGGLDCRHIISNIRPTEYTPLSLTTVCTPHRGSPFMDWLKESIGLGIERQPLPGVPSISPAIPIPQSIISFVDSPAYSNLTSSYLQQHFNPVTPDAPNVKYLSVGARVPKISFFHPLWIPKLILDAHEERLFKQMSTESCGTPAHGPSLRHQNALRQYDFGNDGLVTVESAKWGEFLGILEECDHWDIRGAGGLSAHHAEEVKDQMEKEAKKSSGESGWSWSDWQRFLGAWGEDKSRRDKALEANKGNVRVPISSSSSSSSTEDEVERAKKVEKVVRSMEDPSVKKEIAEKVVRDKERSGQADPSAMDSILDWVVENVPGIETVKVPFKLVAEHTILGTGTGDKDKDKDKDKEREREKDRPPRFDLEKFYLALGRKLYDEGL